jgi:signal transduction histidine kinase
MPRLTLHKKVLFAFLLLALLPLGFLAAYSANNLWLVEDYLRRSATEALDFQASRALVLRAEMVADSVADFLSRVEADLFDLALLEPDAEAYLRFYHQHRRSVWYRSGTNREPVEVRESIPLYQEMAFIDPDGKEMLRIVEGEVSTDLRDVSDLANTTYLTEDYFLQARHLPAGGVYVSPVTGWHVGKQEQLAGEMRPEDAVEGRKYQGVVRFAAPLYAPEGTLQAVVVLSLDHRHLMEFTQHITPTEKKYVVFPSYESGNYAFMFDHEGWIITHPKFWDIRGLDSDGRLVPPYTTRSSPEEVARGAIPYNLLHAGFIHPNYPVVAREVLEGNSGVVDVTNVGGSRKIMAYGPVFYRAAGGGTDSIWGGVTIGAELRQFHQSAIETSSVIQQEVTRFMHRSWLLVVFTMGVVFLAAWRLSRSITGPLERLMDGTRAMARGNLRTEVAVKGDDEVGRLAQAFNAMAGELNHRRERLMKTLKALRRSRKEIIRERNFKQTVFENIETGILTLDGHHRVTSVNGPARSILGLGACEESLDLFNYLQDWPEVIEALRPALEQDVSRRWSQYLQVERNGRRITLRLAFLPLLAPRSSGRILTVEDLTERVNLREHLGRMERLASLGRLSAGIAHEIRNPLTGISIMLDDLHDRLLRNPEDQALIQRALCEMERLEGLVNELLTFATTAQSSLQPGDVAPVLGDILFLVQKQCERSNIMLDEDIQEPLPRFALDAAKLKQAFLNLLTNAIDAMPQGGCLEVAAARVDDHICVKISDTGEGIAPDRLPLIFEPFYTSKGEGTGLGLSITHNIIADHGGRIEVNSRPGEGTEFILWFPLG